jgi:Family of unknown function (DUF6502)
MGAKCTSFCIHTISVPSKPAVPASSDDDQRATLQAALAILEPLAGLLLSRGVRHAQAEELLKTAFVRASARAFAAQGKLPSVSTLSVATGLRRREVQRLAGARQAPPPGTKISLAAQVRARWISDPDYLDGRGQPRRLPRTGAPDEPSFASLAAAVSKDVHARPLLDELLRIGAVQEDGEHVLLLGRLNTPNRSWDSLVAIGGANVADHLSAVLVNLLNQPRPLFEQALFADELSQQSAQLAAGLARDMWTRSAPELTAKLHALVDQDKAASDTSWRMRIGLFSYIEPAERPAAPVRTRAAKAQTPDKPRQPRKRPKPAQE